MSAEQVQKQIVDIVAGQMNMPVDDELSGANVPLGEGGLDLDSIKVIELTTRLESIYGISIPDIELKQVGEFSVGQLADLVVRHVDKR